MNDARACALKVANDVMEEHRDWLAEGVVLPIQDVEWEDMEDEDSSVMAHLCVASSEDRSLDFQRCWVGYVHKNGWMKKAMTEAAVIFRPKAAESMDGVPD